MRRPPSKILPPTNVIPGGCVTCGCEVFVRYHYDDDKPVPDAPFVLIDSNGKEIEGTTVSDAVLLG